MAEPGKVEVEVRTRLSEEGRRELAEMVRRMDEASRMVARLPVAAAKPIPRRTTTTRPSRAKKPEPSLTEYIRKEYEDDQVLQAFADIIDHNPAIWRAMGVLRNLNIKAGDGLRGWNVDRRMEVREALTTTVVLEIIDVEGTKRARS